ncbi:hypothetical protein B0H14DRAFT_2870236 [Mycena olivaceomarginata]|nr:hypothetical protein B0H14DRAFT_2870236 [Mycena olivaceomarginata]
MCVSSACLIALSLFPLLLRRLLSSFTADYPALDSLLCGSPWSDPLVRQRCLTFSWGRDTLDHVWTCSQSQAARDSGAECCCQA